MGGCGLRDSHRRSLGPGAVVADLADLGGWTLVLPDAVHPTALGQLEIADRARRLAAAVVARRRPVATAQVAD